MLCFQGLQPPTPTAPGPFIHGGGQPMVDQDASQKGNLHRPQLEAALVSAAAGLNVSIVGAFDQGVLC